MKKGIIIFGPAGSGKTTLGKMVAEQLDILFVDIDEYIWRKDTEIPFTVMYSRTEKIDRLMEAISETERFVMVGSMDSFHERFDPFFSLGVHLTAPKEVRVERVHQREYKEFGGRILENGDMYEAHQRFLADVVAYDIGGGSTSFSVHNNWAESLNCPVLRLDGSKSLTDNLSAIIKSYADVCTF